MLGEYDYIFYVSPEGVEIEDNGIREIDSDYRNYIDTTISDLLDKYRKKLRKLIYIEGPTSKRVETVRQIIFP